MIYGIFIFNLFKIYFWFLKFFCTMANFKICFLFSNIWEFSINLYVFLIWFHHEWRKYLYDLDFLMYWSLGFFLHRIFSLSKHWMCVSQMDAYPGILRTFVKISIRSSIDIFKNSGFYFLNPWMLCNFVCVRYYEVNPLDCRTSSSPDLFKTFYLESTTARDLA